MDSSHIVVPKTLVMPYSFLYIYYKFLPYICLMSKFECAAMTKKIELHHNFKLAWSLDLIGISTMQIGIFNQTSFV